MSDVDVLRKIEIELRDKIARLESENARLRKAIEKHRDAEGGGIWTYSWYDKELYDAMKEGR